MKILCLDLEVFHLLSSSKLRVAELSMTYLVLGGLGLTDFCMDSIFILSFDPFE